MKHLLLLGIMAMSLNAMGGDKGNGGDVVICGDLVELLDKKEALKKKMTLNLPEGAIAKKVKTVENRLMKLDPLRGQLFQIYSSELLKDIESYKNGSNNLHVITFADENLTDIDDSYEYSLPYGCTKEQLVIRRDKMDIRMYDTYKTEYIINLRLWDKLDDENKAMTVSHEVLYKIADEELGHTDSRLARHLNGIFSSTEQLSFEDYLTYVSQISREFTFEIKGELIADLFLNKINFLTATNKRNVLKTENQSFMNIFEATKDGYLVKRAFLDQNFLYAKDGSFIKATSKSLYYNKKLEYENALINVKNSDAFATYDSQGDLQSIKLTTSGVKEIILNNNVVKKMKSKTVTIYFKSRKVVDVIFK